MKKGESSAFRIVMVVVIALIVVGVVVVFMIPQVQTGNASLGNVTQSSGSLLGNASEGLSDIKVS